uniref:COesterase domain-containing protein n=1 Tax=Anisakis simplex TaxID=6269 RepID=A0A0M3JNJ1_ANISI
LKVFYETDHASEIFQLDNPGTFVPIAFQSLSSSYE